VNPTSLTFNPSGAGIWSTPQTVTVTGVDDDDIDGNVDYTILTAPATSTDSNYDNVDSPDVSVRNDDDDAASFTVTPSGATRSTAELTVQGADLTDDHVQVLARRGPLGSVTPSADPGIPEP
jgi:hypothetical protein